MLGKGYIFLVWHQHIHFDQTEDNDFSCREAQMKVSSERFYPDA